MSTLDGIRYREPEALDIPRRRRIMNGVAWVLDRTPLSARLLDRDRLVRASGLAPDDVPPGLDVLLRSLRDDADLNTLGAVLAKLLLASNLDDAAAHRAEVAAAPEALAVPPRAPVFIVGLNRTGTTFLHRLLCEDDDALFLPTWLTLLSTPAPTLDEWATGRSARITKAERQLKLWSLMSPGFEGKHRLDVHAPEEEAPLLMQTMCAPSFYGAFAVTGYLRWVLDQSAVGPFRVLAERLSLYQTTQAGQRWVLKTPFHLSFLDDLLEVFPDARVIMTHRDPVKSVTSTVDLFEQGQVASTSTPRRADAIDTTVWFCRQMLTRAMASLDRIDPDRVVHIRYADMVADPVATVTGLYEQLGWPLSDAFAARLAASAAQPREGAPPKSYSPEALGLSTDALRAAFADYSARFQVPEESPGRRVT